MEYSLLEMPNIELASLLAELKAWADQEYGRRSEIARELGVTRQMVTNWLAMRRKPNVNDAFKIMAFMQKHRRSMKTTSSPITPQKSAKPAAKSSSGPKGKGVTK